MYVTMGNLFFRGGGGGFVRGSKEVQRCMTCFLSSAFPKWSWFGSRNASHMFTLRLSVCYLLTWTLSMFSDTRLGRKHFGSV